MMDGSEKFDLSRDRGIWKNPKADKIVALELGAWTFCADALVENFVGNFLGFSIETISDQFFDKGNGLRPAGDRNSQIIAANSSALR
jgi:hypothetical protein